MVRIVVIWKQDHGGFPSNRISVTPKAFRKTSIYLFRQFVFLFLLLSAASVFSENIVKSRVSAFQSNRFTSRRMKERRSSPLLERNGQPSTSSSFVGGESSSSLPHQLRWRQQQQGPGWDVETGFKGQTQLLAAECCSVVDDSTTIICNCPQARRRFSKYPTSEYLYCQPTTTATSYNNLPPVLPAATKLAQTNAFRPLHLPAAAAAAEEYSSRQADTGTTIPISPSDLVYFERHSPSSATSSSMKWQQEQQGNQQSVRDESLESVERNVSWKDRLLQISNFASILCILDCTVLPILLVILPFFSMIPGAGGGGASVISMEWLHSAGHSIANYFVLPVGGMAVSTNYAFQHKQQSLALLGASGLFLIAVANGALCFGTAAGDLHAHVHTAALHHVHSHATALATASSSGSWLVTLLHATQNHHGILHRVVNLSGCAMLMLSNFLSHRIGNQNASLNGGSGCNSKGCTIC